MSIPEPPSFDDFFSKQQAQRQQSTDSQHSQNNQPAQGTSYGFSSLGPGQPFQDEPGSLSRRDSNASMTGHRRLGSASSVNDRLRTVRGEGSSDSSTRRQDSFPFPIESTIISTASGVHQAQHGQDPRNNIGDVVYGGASPYQSQQQHHPQQQHQQQMFDQSQTFQYGGQSAQYASASWTGQETYGGQYGNQSSSFPGGTPSTAGSGFMLDQQSPFGSATFDAGQQTLQQQSAGWGSEFIGQENRHAGGEAFSWAGDAGGQESIDALLNVEDPLAELERIISNSQVGSHPPTREATPLPIDNGMSSQFQPDQSDQLLNQAVFDSAVSSRSTSPYPSAAMSQIISPPHTGAFQRNSPSPHPSSPFFNKSQSPPALIIPNSQHSPSPVLPPIVTSAAPAAPNQQQPGAGAGTAGTAGGLFPPANPALEGLTGMAGISPIGPNADGPMIYIQPSTPISGLKDGRGVFDFKHATQAQQARHHAQQSQQQGNDGYNVPPPASHNLSRHSSHEALDKLAQAQPQQQGYSQDQQWSNGANQAAWNALRPGGNVTRPRAKSDSQMGMVGSDVFDRQAYFGTMMPNLPNMPQFSIPEGVSEDALRAAIDSWRLSTSSDPQVPAPTVDPRSLPGQDGQSADYLNELKLSQQFAQLQAQRNRLPPLNTATGALGKAPPGQFSPTSLAFYSQLGVDPRTASQLGTVSAPFYQSSFEQLSVGQWPQTAGAGQNLLTPEPGLGPRRRSFAEGMSHPAAGAGTPGYGVEFTRPSPFGTLDPGRIRGVSPGHRRAAKSEDLGRPSGGWGVGAGGSTADFLNSITANDGTLLPPSRGRSHSRQSSVSSVRSPSPALSVSSQGSSYGGSPGRMDMPDGVQVPQLYHEQSRAVPGKKRVAKMKVTSMATEVASSSRRTNDGVFKCPVPGCGSTFTRHFNLKGHLRSHNDERPYKCLYDGCPKAVVGFARQHDCKRHMLLHEGLRPFECEGCGKKFARLDALTRHHKSEQGQECAISHPLPVNPDGTPMSESQYKAYRATQHNMNQHAAQQAGMPFNGDIVVGEAGGLERMKREGSFQGYLSGDDRSGGEEDIGGGSGMEDYDRY